MRTAHIADADWSGMSDLIDRKTLLDKFNAMCEVCGKREKYNGVMCRACALDDAIALVEDISSAEPERKWTLVTEALPINDVNVIVSVLDDSGDTPYRFTSVGWCTPDGQYWVVDNEMCPGVIAWKPLPKPWRGEE